mgnify:CR=1 FL=1
MTNKQVRVRYAPSPTGQLHIGGARTALFNYLFARKMGGTFILRIEDTDQTRHVEDAEAKQMEGLSWLGIKWDEGVAAGGDYGPCRQSERLAIYAEYLQQLPEKGAAYECFCTEEELAEERAAQEARGETPMYSGKCRNLTSQEKEKLRADGRKPTLRFLVPKEQIVVHEDLVRGRVEFETNGIGDFIIARPDGIPMYNFACVIDDYTMKISHVIRGEEHLSNTPRQLLLYEAFGWDKPQFAHISLILNPDRKKMSKRDESIIQFVEQYKELGYLPEAVVNFIALLGWSPKGEEELFTLAELEQEFDLKRIQKSPAIFDTEKLAWMNNTYMKQADSERITELSLPHLQRAGRLPQELDEAQRTYVKELVQLYQDRMRAASDIVGLTELFFREEVKYEAEAAEITQESHVKEVAHAFLAQVRNADDFSAESIGPLIKNVQKETGYKGKQLFMPIRVVLTGQNHGPDLNRTIHLLGRERVIRRLEQFVQSATS